MAQKPKHVDMGTKFPMRSVYKPNRGGFASGAKLATLFLFLPLAYFFDKGISFQELTAAWWLLILLLVGLLGLYSTVAAFYDRVVFEINGVDARVSMRQLLRGTTTSVAPLTEYTALLTSIGKEPGFIGQRDNYQITLFHGKESVKQVTLYFGVKKDVFEQRLAEYQRLFGLPVNPEGLGVLAIQAG